MLVLAKAVWNCNLSPLASANGNERTILYHCRHILCDGLVKNSIGFSPKNAITDNDLFGTVNILKAIALNDELKR